MPAFVRWLINWLRRLIGVKELEKPTDRRPSKSKSDIVGRL
jgi:hypothetical protein